MHKNVYVVLTKSLDGNVFVYCSRWNVAEAKKIVEDQNKRGIKTWYIVTTPE